MPTVAEVNKRVNEHSEKIAVLEERTLCIPEISEKVTIIHTMMTKGNGEIGKWVIRVALVALAGERIVSSIPK